MPYNFRSVGSAISDELVKVAAEREALRRQAMLDQITQQREARLIKSDADDAAYKQELIAGQKEARAATAAVNAENIRAKQIDTAGKLYKPGQVVDEGTKKSLPPELLKAQMTLPATSITAPKSIEQKQSPTGQTTFAGTTEQRDQEAILSDPNVPQNVKQIILSGGKPTAEMFRSPTINIVQARRNGSTQVIGSANRDDHIVNEPAPQMAPFPVVIQGSIGSQSGPGVVNRGTGEFNFLTGPNGERVNAAPTAEMRNRQESMRGMVPLLNTMKQMSDGIITQVGPAQRLDAVKRGAETVFGHDPNFRTYQDFRNSLGVMIAVATQGSRPSDADVFKAALPMVPNPYSDTSESAQQKWNLIFSMFRSRLSPEMQKELGFPGAGGNVGGGSETPEQRRTRIIREAQGGN